MLKEIVTIDRKFERFTKRFISAIKVHFWVLIGMVFYMGIVYGWEASTLSISGIIMVLAVLYGWYKASTMLYAISVDEEHGIVEIRTLYYNTVKVAQFEKKRVKVNVIVDALSRYNADLIRIDVDRKTFFTQKQSGPWTADKIEQAKQFPK